MKLHPLERRMKELYGTTQFLSNAAWIMADGDLILQTGVGHYSMARKVLPTCGKQDDCQGEFQRITGAIRTNGRRYLDILAIGKGVTPHQMTRIAEICERGCWVDVMGKSKFCETLRGAKFPDIIEAVERCRVK